MPGDSAGRRAVSDAKRSPPGVEWAAVTPTRIIIATAERSWVQESVWGGLFSQPMRGPGSEPTTHNLLEGAARCAWTAPVHESAPAFTVENWAYRLCGLYQTTHATARLMGEVAERFARACRWTLASWAEKKAREERGHDMLALRDLRALGYDAEAVVAALVPEGTAVLVRYFEQQVRAEDPLGCVGYSHALERLALLFTKDYVAGVEASLPLGVRATRCLRAHSALGGDLHHAQENVETVAALSAHERAIVARTCYETTLLCRESAYRVPPSATALRRLLKPFSLWCQP